MISRLLRRRTVGNLIPVVSRNPAAIVGLVSHVMILTLVLSEHAMPFAHRMFHYIGHPNEKANSYDL